MLRMPHTRGLTAWIYVSPIEAGRDLGRCTTLLVMLMMLVLVCPPHCYQAMSGVPDLRYLCATQHSTLNCLDCPFPYRCIDTQVSGRLSIGGRPCGGVRSLPGSPKAAGGGGAGAGGGGGGMLSVQEQWHQRQALKQQQRALWQEQERRHLEAVVAQRRQQQEQQQQGQQGQQVR